MRRFRRGAFAGRSALDAAPVSGGTTYVVPSAGGARSDNGVFRFTNGGFMLETI